jgi:hypothetical protein
MFGSIANQAGGSRWGRTPLMTLLVLGSALLGCSRRAEVTLRQPFAPPSQQELKLESRWAFTAVSDGRRVCLLDFPLPDTEDGPRDFHIYLTLPDVDDEQTVAADDADGPRGFLIQEVGRLRGKTEFAAGTVRCRRVFLQSRTRRLDLDVRCSDGASITGKAIIRIDGRELRHFEREFAADIKSLEADIVQSEESSKPTAPRNAPVP